MTLSIKSLLKSCVLKKEWVDYFLDPDKPKWAQFDSELGYILHSSVMKDGIDGASSVYTFSKTGERKIVNYQNIKCRINTYGNSFTQCHQVSDGETWQEILAAHFGEPLRNYGVGGYGLYQAYIRMLREEKINSVPYIIFNIWSDDHYRSLDIWKWIGWIDYFREQFHKDPILGFFHANPWAYLRIDKSGNFIEYKNPYSTGDSLYKLTDFTHVYNTFKDDPMVHLYLAQKKGKDVNLNILEYLAHIFDVDIDLSSPDSIAKSANAIHTEYAFRSSMYILDKMKKYADKNNKKIILLLSYSDVDVVNMIKKGIRFDTRLLNYLKANKFSFVDTLIKHKKDYNDFNISPEEYTKRYYIGHYNPQGNHFFAYAIKDDIIKWLNPKPVTYRENQSSVKDLASYLA